MQHGGLDRAASNISTALGGAIWYHNPATGGATMGARSVAGEGIRALGNINYGNAYKDAVAQADKLGLIGMDRENFIAAHSGKYNTGRALWHAASYLVDP